MSADTSGVLQLASNNGTVALTIGTSQNIGVGTASPINQFDIRSNSSTAAGQYNSPSTLVLWNNSPAGNIGGTIAFGGAAPSSNSTAFFASIYSAVTASDSTGTNGYLSFATKTNQTDTSLSERGRFDQYGNFIVGGTNGLGSTGGRIAIYGTSGGQNGFLQVTNPGYGTGVIGIQGTSPNFKIYNSYSAGTLAGGSGIDITSGGSIVVAGTTAIGSGRFSTYGGAVSGDDCWCTKPLANITYNPAVFYNNAGTLIGYIQCSTSATTFGTASDYRLKENILPMVGALDKVSQLKPVTYKWKVDGSDGQGFIAHELQKVVPDCVIGEKDQVNEDGSIKPQGIDTSFLVATLTAAIQELNAKVTALEEQVLNLGVK
jgi:hypothetical protein